MRGKKTIECDKSIVTCDVSIAQYANETIKCEKNNNSPTECDKNTIRYTLVLLNVTMKLSNVREKKMKVLPNVTKVWLDVILVLPYVMMKLSNVRKNNSTIKCDKITVRSNVSIAQYDNETVK